MLSIIDVVFYYSPGLLGMLRAVAVALGGLTI